MKIELDRDPKDIERIAQRVAELLKPWLAEVANLADRQCPQSVPMSPPRSARKTGEYRITKTVAEYLGISPGSISNWIWRGDIPFA